MFINSTGTAHPHAGQLDVVNNNPQASVLAAAYERNCASSHNKNCRAGFGAAEAAGAPAVAWF